MIEECWFKITENKCDVLVPNEKCKTFMACVKRKPIDKSSVQYWGEVLELSLENLSKKAQGLVLLAALICLIRLIQVMGEKTEKK
jgi:hypothetical protein